MAASRIFDRVEDFRIVAGFVEYAREEQFLHEVPQGQLLQAVLAEPSDVDRYDRNALNAAFHQLQELVHQRMGLMRPSDPDGWNERPTMPPPGAVAASSQDQLPPSMPGEIRARISSLRARVAAMHQDARDTTSRREEALSLHVHFNRLMATIARIEAAMAAPPPQVRKEATAFLDRVEKDLATAERILHLDDANELDDVADEVMTELAMVRGLHRDQSAEERQEARALDRLAQTIGEAIASGRAFSVRFPVIEAYLRAQRLLEPYPGFTAQASLPPPRPEMPTLPEAELEPRPEPKPESAPVRSQGARQDTDIAELITQAVDDCQRLLGTFGRDEVGGHIMQRYRQLQYVMASHFDEERMVALIFGIRSDLEMVERIHRARNRSSTGDDVFRVLVQEVRGESLAAAEKLEHAGEEVAVMRAYGQRLVDDYGLFSSEPEPHYEPLRRLLLEVHVEAARVLTPYGRIADQGQGGDPDGSQDPSGGSGKRDASIGGFTAGTQAFSSAPLSENHFQASILATIGIINMPVFVAFPAAVVRGPAFA